MDHGLTRRLPRCGSTRHKKNGHLHNGKQNHRCKAWGRPFVLAFAQRRVSAEHRALVERLLQEGLSLKRHLPYGRRGHERADGFSESSATRQRPPTLTFRSRKAAVRSWSVPWGRKRMNSGALWATRRTPSGCGWRWMPTAARSLLSMSAIAAKKAHGGYGTSFRWPTANTRRFTRMLMQPTAGSFPGREHRTITKVARKTNHVERFNGTLRQRLSRLVRSALSFSKNLANHIGAIRYFICHYNLTRAACCRDPSISR